MNENRNHMSNQIAKAERSKAKDARQMPAPNARPKHRAKKKDKPWRVEYKWSESKHLARMFSWAHEWSTFGKYRTEKEARIALENDSRKHDFYEYRITYKE